MPVIRVRSTDRGVDQAAVVSPFGLLVLVVAPGLVGPVELDVEVQFPLQLRCIRELRRAARAPNLRVKIISSSPLRPFYTGG